MKGPKSVLDPVIEGYLSYLADVGRKAPRTITDVRCTLKRLIEDLAVEHAGLPLWQLSLDAFITWLNRQRAKGRNGRSLAKSLSHVRGLLEYAWRIGQAQRNVLDGFDIQDEAPRIPPDVLSVSEARQLITACPAENASARQERMIILLLYGCGLRTDELCSLDLRDIDREKRELLIRRGKGDRQRTVPIPERLYTELLAYLAERGGHRGPLFRTVAKRMRLRTHRVCQIVRDAATRTGMTRLITPRTLRHSYATHLMDQGVDLAIIASLMGHRSPAETGVYLHVLKDQPERAVAQLTGAQGGVV
jgi:integrase/recombinase XerD